jgi:eukaryotic-like serine/threonine-protein kinase
LSEASSFASRSKRARRRGSSPTPGGTRLDDVLDFSRHTLALTRDGRRLAFVARDAAGRRRIYLRALDSVEAVPVAGTEDGDMPFFSPDGTTLGFASEGRLKRVGLTGGQATTICDAPEPRGATWTDDGTIVFAPGVFGGLQRVTAAGGVPVPVTTLDARTESSHRWPTALPGGRHVLLSVHPSGAAESARHIDLLDLGSGQRRTLTRGAYPRYVEGQLLYGESGRLLAAPLDVAGQRLSGPAMPVLDDVRMDTGGTGLVAAEVSPSGTLVYVPGAQTSAERTLVWLDRSGRATPAARERRPYLGVRLSPDNRSAAAIVQGTPNSLWQLDFARDAWTRLTTGEGAATPVWTPDGARIVFTDTDLTLFAVPAGGGAAPRRIFAADGPTGDMPAISPDGRVLLLGVQDTRGDDIVSVPLDGGRAPEPFEAGPANETSPAVSPGGRWVAYTSSESGRREVYIRRFAGPGRKWVVSLDGGSAPRWRRDERELFYLQGSQVMAVPVRLDGDAPELGAARALFDDAAFSWSGADLFRYDVAADGQRFIAVRPDPREQRTLQLVVVPGFAAEMRQRLTR